MADIHLGIAAGTFDLGSLQTEPAFPRSISLLAAVFVCSKCWWGAFASCSDLLLKKTNKFTGLLYQQEKKDVES